MIGSAGRMPLSDSGEPEHHRTGERAGQALQPAEHRRGVGVDHQQGERDVAEHSLAAGQQDPGEGGE